MGEVWYEYQSQTIAHASLVWTSLQLALSKPLDQPDSSLWIEELWVNARLFNSPVSDYIAPTPLDDL